MIPTHADHGSMMHCGEGYGRQYGFNKNDDLITIKVISIIVMIYELLVEITGNGNEGQTITAHR
jgi:hypothetical protein